MRSAHPAWFAAIALLAASALPAAQQPPEIFRSGVDIVRLDVSVLDQNRRPVLGLTAADFTILVDGVLQPIVAFEPVVLPPREVPTAPWMRDVASDVRTNALGEPRLFIIVMDDVSTPADPFQVDTARRVALSVVEELKPGDLAAVLFTDPYGRRRSQDLTDDRGKLRQAIDSFRVGMGGPLMRVNRERTLKDALTLLSGRPQNRSALIYIGPGIGDLFRAGRGGTRGELERVLEDQFTPTIAEVSDLRGIGQFARIPVYWFSTRGFTGDAFAGDTQFGDGLHPLIASAGGRAITNTNTPAAYVQAVFEENSAYYLVGYRATYPVTDGRYRRMQIRVSRPDVQVYPGDRTVLSPKPPAGRRPRTAPSPLFGAMGDILPQSDVRLEVSVAPYAIPRTRGGATTALAVTVGVRVPSPEAPVEESVELLGRIFTLQGKTVTSVEQSAAMRLVPLAGDARFELVSRVELKPGRYLLRYSVRSPRLDRTGSVYTDLTVPDFSRAPLSLSGIVLGATPAPPTAPADALAGLLPVAPTTLREFTASHAVEAFVRAYQGGRRLVQPVDVAAVLTDRYGVETVVRADRLAAAQFGSARAADYTVALPLATLAPGPYLLTIRATAGESTARGDVRFVVVDREGTGLTEGPGVDRE